MLDSVVCGPNGRRNHAAAKTPKALWNILDFVRVAPAIVGRLSATTVKIAVAQKQVRFQPRCKAISHWRGALQMPLTDLGGYCAIKERITTPSGLGMVFDRTRRKALAKMAMGKRQH